MSQSSLPSLRVIFFTVQPPMMANTLIKAFEALDQQMLLVVTTPGRKKRSNRVYQAIVANSQSDVDILVSNHMDQLPAILSGLAPDLIFVSGFPLRLPPALLALPRLGCVNAHPSLLPKYRGPNPLFWQFMRDEMQTGMTMHRMDTDFDTGPILVQHSLDIAPDDDLISIWPKLLNLEVSMLPEMLAAVASGAEGTPQPTISASYAPFPAEINGRLDWTRPATYLLKQIRSSGLKGICAVVDGQTIVVRRARVVSSSPALASASAGGLLACSTKEMLIQTGEDALLITDYASRDQAQPQAFPDER